MWWILEAVEAVVWLSMGVALNYEWRMVSWFLYWSIFMAIVPSMLIFISIPNSSSSELQVFCSSINIDIV